MPTRFIYPPLEVLEYESKATPPVRSGSSGSTLAAISAACTVVPIAGLVLRSGPIFITGVFLTMLGVVLGLVALSKGQRRLGRIAGAAAATIGNLLIIGMLFWMFFIHGMC